MEKFKKILPAILMILFELVVGILLFINPQGFTLAVFIIFGSVLMLSALILLLRYLKDSKRAAAEPTGLFRASKLTLFCAIVTFVFGAVFAFGSSMLYGFTGLLIIFYGAVMVIKGLFKVSDYFSLKKEGYGVTALQLIIGILSVLLGGLIIFNPFGALEAVFMIAAIYLIVEAVFDIVALILSVRMMKVIDTEVIDAEVQDISDEAAD